MIWTGDTTGNVSCSQGKGKSCCISSGYPRLKKESIKYESLINNYARLNYQKLFHSSL